MMDHIVLAVPDLAGGVGWFQGLTGFPFGVRGSQFGVSTANCLVGLSATADLQIVGPDPAQPGPAGPRPFGIKASAPPGRHPMRSAAPISTAPSPPRAPVATTRGPGGCCDASAE